MIITGACLAIIPLWGRKGCYWRYRGLSWQI